jgi:hypothetical protein
MADKPSWPADQAAFGAGAIVLVLTTVGEVVLLPPVKFFERLLLLTVVTGILAAVVRSARVGMALGGFAAFLFVCFLGTEEPTTEGGRWPFIIPILMAAILGRGYHVLRRAENASHGPNGPT